MEVATFTGLAFLVIAIVGWLSRRQDSVSLQLEAVPSGVPRTSAERSGIRVAGGKQEVLPPGPIEIVVANHEKVIADTLAIILNKNGYATKACYSGVDALETVLALKPKLAILCIVPAGLRDLNGVYAAVTIRSLLPECEILLTPGGSGAWVTEPLELASSKGFDFTMLGMPVHPKDLFEKIRERLGPRPKPQPESRKRILYLDDHEVLARLACEILEMQGYEAVPVYDANQAIAIFRRERFDLVVTDHNHPAPDGTEMARRMKEAMPEVPIILVTGNPPHEISGDFAKYLPKEQLFPELLEEIRMQIGPGVKDPRVKTS